MVQDIPERVVLDAIVSVASLEVLERLCSGLNSAYSTRSLSELIRREAHEVREAVDALARVGVIRRETAANGETLYSLSPAAGVWRFARSFSQHFGQDAAYSQCFIDALVRNTGQRAAQRAAA
jgi:hypothetical protein